MLPDSDYLTFDLAPLDEPGFWPRPLLLVVELGSGGRVAVSSTLHKLFGRERLPIAHPDPGMGILTTEWVNLTAPWPPDPPLPALYREVRRAVLHTLYPEHLAKDLHKAGKLSDEDLKRVPHGELPHEQQVAAVWQQAWDAIRPHLNTEALELTRDLGGHLEIYNMLAGNQGCRELVRFAPILGALLDPAAPVVPMPGVRRRQTVSEIVRRLAGLFRVPVKPVESVNRGFMTWIEKAPMRPVAMPRLDHLYTMRHMGQVMAEAGGVVTPEKVNALATDEEWYLLHAAAQLIGMKGVAAVLRDPQAALQTLDKAPPNITEPDVWRRWSHLRRCFEIGGAMHSVPDRFKRVRSLRRMLEIAREVERERDKALRDNVAG
jgi:hypothetical protein